MPQREIFFLWKRYPELPSFPSEKIKTLTSHKLTSENVNVTLFPKPLSPLNASCLHSSSPDLLLPASQALLPAGLGQGWSRPSGKAQRAPGLTLIILDLDSLLPLSSSVSAGRCWSSLDPNFLIGKRGMVGYIYFLTWLELWERTHRKHSIHAWVHPTTHSMCRFASPPLDGPRFLLLHLLFLSANSIPKGSSTALIS